MSDTKDNQILKMLTEAAGRGMASKDLQATLQSTRKGVCAAIWRLRQQGHKIAFRREEGGRSRFFLAEHFPGKWVRPRGKPTAAMATDAAKKIRELVSRPEGACRLDILLKMGSSRRQAARKELARMIEQGEAIEYRMPRTRGKPMVRVYSGPAPEGWLSPEQFAARGKAKTAKPAKPKKTPKPAKPAQKPAKPAPTVQRSAQPWQPPQAKALPEPIIPPNVKRVLAEPPLFDHRYQVDPRTRVVGGFATLGPGRYLNDERRAA